MFLFLALIIIVVSLLAYAGIATLHDRLSDARHAAAVYIAPPSSLTAEGEWDGRHPKDARCRRMAGGCYVQRNR